MHSLLGRLQVRIIRMPVIGPIIQSTLRRYFSTRFKSSESYWIERYEKGGTSGPGSYDKLAQYKAEILNSFVAEQQIDTVIEFGCGDGNQLRLARYPHYTGFDISPAALARCRAIFADDATKSFRELKEYAGESAELTLSLDVIFHLIEDSVYQAYMQRLFDASSRFVVIYSSNQDEQTDVVVAHVKHRRFTSWVEQNRPSWRLVQHIPNRYTYEDDPGGGSFADFYIYEHQS